MLRLTTLGAVDLRDSQGHVVRDALAQPKRVALLVYLALEGRRGPVSRDRLLALFWPESDEDHARNTLSQALHRLRQMLGPGVIESFGASAVQVHAEQLWCDAAVFADAINRGDVDLALDLYRGEFCPTLFVTGAPDVEGWLDEQRRRLRGLALAGARTQAERLASRGDVEPASRAARRALALQPEDEGDVRALLALLEQCGDVAGALLAYEDFSRRLAESLETEPASATRELVAAMQRRRGGEVAGARTAAPVGAGAVHAQAAQGADRRRGLWRIGGVAAATAIVGALAWWAFASTARRPPEDPHLVVVAPFRVAGADSVLGFLREGMLDLLAAKLTGEGGLRTTDPRTVASLWPRTPQGRMGDLSDSAALRKARSIGAGKLLLGSVVGRSERLTITATLLETRRAGESAPVSVTGRLDSLQALVDALAAQLLSQGAGEPTPLLPSLTSASLSALKAYLDGQSAFRAGRYAESERDLWNAVQLDSTFALAWSELVQVADWVPGSDTRVRAGPVAWSLRDHLGAADRALLAASIGPAYPAWPSYRQRLESWEAAARLAPERPESWYGLGDAYFHFGQLLGRDSGFVQAEAALARATALDSAFMAPLVHLVQIAILRDDTAAVRRLWALYARRDTTSESAAYLRWRVAVALGDSATARRVEAAFDTLPVGVLNRVASWSIPDGVGIDVAWRAARTALLRSSGTDQPLTKRIFLVLAGNLGRFAERDAVWGRPPGSQATRTELDAQRVNEEVLLDGDTAAGRAALARLRADTVRSSESTTCALATWLLLRPGPSTDTTGLGAGVRACQRLSTPIEALIVRALYAARAGTATADQLLAQLDSARGATVGNGGNVLSLIQGRVLMIRGEYAGARDAFRRRELGSVEAGAYYAPLLRYEGRAAELAGDAAGAIRAYRRYLALRSHPDAGSRLWADSARSALARLARQPRG